MLDSHGRNIDYLRMSLTPRCQQRCTYCARETGGVCVKEREMTAENFIFTASVFASLGFSKIRLTGGEPLLRRDIVEIVGGISALGKYEDIALTTNGLELGKLCEPLARAGLSRVNISLDSTQPEVYRSITGAQVAPVIDAIKKAVRIFDKVKINAVVMKGVNEDISGLLQLAREYPVDVRFIELMPMGGGGDGISGNELLSRMPFLMPAEKRDIHSPETVYSADGYKGNIGFISSLSHSFCKDCNRMRLTWDGKLRPCLGVNSETDVRDMIIAQDEDALKKIITETVINKPIKNDFSDGFSSCRPMSAIGG